MLDHENEEPLIRSPRSLREAGMALAGLSAVFLFEMLDNSILNVALPTIGRELGASTIALQWVTGAYAVVFGGLMLAFGAIADRFGRRRVMLAGLGLLGLAIAPVVGGFVLAIAPWQVLLLLNVPIAVLAIIGVRTGIAADRAGDLHRDPVDILGAVLGTAAIVLALFAPTLFVNEGAGSWAPWTVTGAAAVGAIFFLLRERSARHPLLDLGLVARPLVSSGLAYKAAAGLATAGLGYVVTLQLQLDWGWPPALAALGMLPQVIVLVGAGPFINPFVVRVGIGRAAWLGATAVVLGLAIYSPLSRFGYVWVAVALILVAAGMRVV